MPLAGRLTDTATFAPLAILEEAVIILIPQLRKLALWQLPTCPESTN